MLVKNILGITIDIPQASYEANKNAFTTVEEVKEEKETLETTEMRVEEVKTTVMKKK